MSPSDENTMIERMVRSDAEMSSRIERRSPLRACSLIRVK